MGLKHKLLAQARSKTADDPENDADSAPNEVPGASKEGTDNSSNEFKAVPALSKAGTEYSPKEPRREVDARRLSQHEPLPRSPRLGKTPLAPYEKPARGARGRYLPGNSGNPRGPRMGFVEYVRLQTSDGQELVDHAIECLRGRVQVRWEDQETGQELERWMPADPKYQAEARAWLAERGYGKALQTIEVQQSQEQAIDYSKLSTDETRTLLELMAKAEGTKALESGAIAHITGFESQAPSEGETDGELVDSPTVSPGD